MHMINVEVTFINKADYLNLMHCTAGLKLVVILALAISLSWKLLSDGANYFSCKQFSPLQLSRLLIVMKCIVTISPC